MNIQDSLQSNLDKLTKTQSKTMNMHNINMLRQWLNEDRIDDPDKMVTNEQLLTWLEPSDKNGQLKDWDQRVLEVGDEIYSILYEKSVVKIVRVLYEDEWPVEELKQLIQEVTNEQLLTWLQLGEDVGVDNYR